MCVANRKRTGNRSIAFSLMTAVSPVQSIRTQNSFVSVPRNASVGVAGDRSVSEELSIGSRASSTPLHPEELPRAGVAPVFTHLGEGFDVPPVTMFYANDANSSGATGPVSTNAGVFAGVLFPSFDHEANYQAKQQELRRLGFSLEDEAEASARRATTAATPSVLRTKSSVPSQLVSSEDDLTAAVLERQMRRRDEIYAASQRRAAEEAKQFTEMISHLRGEVKRRDVVTRDSNSNLAAQVEALQYVVQRRNDADNEHAALRFVDVEHEVLDVAREWSGEHDDRLRFIAKVGEQSALFVEHLAQDVTTQAGELQSPAVVSRELDETGDLLMQELSTKISMTVDRVRSELHRVMCDELREAFLATTGSNRGGTTEGGVGVSRGTRTLFANFVAADVADICKELQAEWEAGVLRRAAESFSEVHKEIHKIVPLHFSELELRVGAIVDAKLQERADELEAERAIIQQHLEDVRSGAEHRREREEAMLRDMVLQTGKLLEAQRLSTNELRSQLVMVARAQQQPNKTLSALRSSNNLRSSPNSPTGGQGINADSPRAGSVSVSRAGSARAGSPSASRKLLFEPLSQEQIKSLYGALPSHATVVEEVSLDQLSKLTAKASKSRLSRKGSSVHEQDQLILVTRAPASLLGRNSSLKQPTRLTSAGSFSLSHQSVAAPGAPDSTVTDADLESNTSPLSAREAYSTGELAALQELRRLRVKMNA